MCFFKNHKKKFITYVFKLILSNKNIYLELITNVTSIRVNLSIINYPDISFFLIGDDEVEIDLSSIPNVVSAKDYDLNLAQQLALVSKSYGFIGMASGISSAANFSDIPYVIIKDPSHHSYEMEEELGEGDYFNFSCESQFLWRKQQSVDLLNNALKLINEQNKS